MFIAQGTSCSVTIAAIWSSQPRSSSVVRALVAGKQPITPDLQALITICGPVTKNIGAQIAGIRIRDLINEMEEFAIVLSPAPKIGADRCGFFALSWLRSHRLYHSEH